MEPDSLINIVLTYIQYENYYIKLGLKINRIKIDDIIRKANNIIKENKIGHIYGPNLEVNIKSI